MQIQVKMFGNNLEIVDLALFWDIFFFSFAVESLALDFLEKSISSTN